MNSIHITTARLILNRPEPVDIRLWTSKGEIKLGCSLEENPGEVTFWVTDTGPGIPADQAEAIFNRFTKLNDFVQGTGLGLSICRDIAGKMNGRVYLDTSYTGGARFVLVLPDTLPQQNI